MFAGIFGLLIGAVGVWTGIHHLRNRALFDRWDTTRGKVIERGSYVPKIPPTGPPAFRYAPLVRYSYQVAGKDYVSDTILPRRIQLPQHNTRKWAYKQAASFQDEVTVHYNPRDPGESYLILTSKKILYLAIAASGVVILFGLGFLLTG
ncbi:MAG: DUF3592 domain-containing protein [Pyrinomonadaceae bacterium]